MNYRDYLCVYDPESEHYAALKDSLDNDIPKPRNSCACDNCFYSRDKLAMRIRKLEIAIREHKDSFSKDRDENTWIENETLWALVEERK